MSSPLDPTPAAPPAPAPAAAAGPAAASSDIAQPGDDTLGNMGWNDPRAANASTKDFVMAHLASLGSGLSQIGGAAADYARTAANTYGAGDSTLASLKALYGDATGNTQGTDYLSSLAKAKADTAAASSRLGTAGTIAANVTGAGPLGDVAGAVKGMIPAAGRFAGPLAGAITGGGATAAGEAGRNESLSPWDIGIGTVTGGVGGAPSQGSTLAPAQSAADLLAQAKKAYKPLNDVIYDASKEVHPTLDPIDAQNALRDWSGYKWNDASKTSGEINTLLKKPQLTANDLQQSQSYLKGIASDGRSDPNDAMYAAHYAGKLQDVLDNATPQTGVPQNWKAPAMPTSPPPAAGQGTMTVNGQPFKYANGQWTPPSFAATQKAAGDALYGKSQDVGRLDDWIAKSQVAGGGAGTDVGAQASSYLRSNAGQTFAAPGTPQYDALNKLAGTAAKESSIPWWVKHFVIAPTAGTAINEGIQAGTGGHETPVEHVVADLGMGAALATSMAGYGAYSGARARAAQQAAIDATRSTFSTGSLQAPAAAPSSAFGDAIRRLLLSQGAAGKIPGQ
jgi:hypothetical protein